MSKHNMSKSVDRRQPPKYGVAATIAATVGSVATAEAEGHQNTFSLMDTHIQKRS